MDRPPPRSTVSATAAVAAGRVGPGDELPEPDGDAPSSDEAQAEAAMAKPMASATATAGTYEPDRLGRCAWIIGAFRRGRVGARQGERLLVGGADGHGRGPSTSRR